MCGRVTLTTPNAELVAALVGAILEPETAAAYRPRYNIAPTDRHPVVQLVEGRPRLRLGRWGLVAAGAPLIINARAETLQPGRRRCLVPVDGFYEWRRDHHPVWYHAPSGLLLLAGQYEMGADGPEFAIVTTEANGLIAPVHGRMPAILSLADGHRWLEQPTAVRLGPAPDGALEATPVSDRANSVAHDDPACIAPAPHPPKAQLDLFES